MTVKEIIIALTIHLIIPLVGLICFLKLKKQMEIENVQKAPKIELFIIFANYGGLIIVALTALFWKWSGMASLGIFYLIVGAPITMGIIAYKHRNIKAISKYHNWTYISGLSYFLITPLTIVILSFASEN
jgi:hypothetical protein